MSRNRGYNFSAAPQARIERSRFNRNSSVKFTFNVGDLIPFYVDEVLPGDTFDVKTSKVVRLQSLLTPIMDNLYLDTYFFFVPNRLVWDHWREFCGENTESEWIPSTEYAIPQVVAPTGNIYGVIRQGWQTGTIADYMGIPVGVEGLSVSALPFRAYALICNEWFRDENLQHPLVVYKDDATVVGDWGNVRLPYDGPCRGGLPYKVCKYHDYFTSCLPSAQKGPAVSVPLVSDGNLPVVPLAERVPTSVLPSVPTQFYHASFDSTPQYNGSSIMFGSDGSQVSGGSPSTEQRKPVIDNLWAINDGNISLTTINQLRMAFQIQRLYERDARGGTRYIEILKAHFGVSSPDARLQRPEYLGGNRIPINISQVLQSSGTQQDGTPQGTPVGVSLTTDNHSDFCKSFVEHGYVIGVMCARYHHTYQQGIERFWSRKSRFDFYWPALANIGEQAVLNKEIYAQGPMVLGTGGTPVDDQVFGYQEAWADYRYKPNRVAGEMRSRPFYGVGESGPGSLDCWHLSDDYKNMPTLSSGWIREDDGPLDRCLAVSSRLSNQLLADLYIENRTTRPMPLYSIPGLIDHH